MANVIFKLDSSKSKLADFLHGCLFSPCPSTLMQAIKNNHFGSWPGMNKINFKTYVQDNIATIKGHMNQGRKNLRSTKIKDTVQEEDDFFPTEAPMAKQHFITSSLVQHSPKYKAYGDLTGKFPFKSSRGNCYIYGPFALNCIHFFKFFIVTAIT